MPSAADFCSGRHARSSSRRISKRWRRAQMKSGISAMFARRACSLRLENVGPPVTLVRGNCDSNSDWPLMVDLKRNGVRFRLVHIPPARAPENVDVVLHASHPRAAKRTQGRRALPQSRLRDAAESRRAAERRASRNRRRRETKLAPNDAARVALAQRQPPGSRLASWHLKPRTNDATIFCGSRRANGGQGNRLMAELPDGRSRSRGRAADRRMVSIRPRSFSSDSTSSW